MLTNTKVLIVEDEPTLAENILAQVKRCNGSALIASSGKQAVANAYYYQPEVILLDYHLPDMDGFDIIDAIRDLGIDCPCVLMTGHPVESLLAETIKRGIRKILSKPFALGDLVLALVAARDQEQPAELPRVTINHRHQPDRRAGIAHVFIAVLLNDGTWLTEDRRVSERRR